MARRTPFSPVWDVLLGQEARRRRRSIQSLQHLGSSLAIVVFHYVNAYVAQCEPLWVGWFLAMGSLVSGVVFYGLVRTGWSERLASPSMLPQQILVNLVFCVSAYALMGPSRTIAMLMVVMLVLFGMSQLPARMGTMLAVAAVASMTLAMVWNVRFAADPVPWRTELMHFVAMGLAVATSCAMALRLMRLRAALENQKAKLAEASAANHRLATCDALTGLLNRRAMTAELDALQEAAPGAPAAALAVLDIDWFKRVNDEHGHRAGDEVLVRFAQTAQTALREGDVLARWGGEEFLVLMPCTEPAEATQVLGQLAQALQAVSFDDVAPGLRVTFSAGVARWQTPSSHELVVERADRALYAAKAAGRNRSEMAREDHASAALAALAGRLDGARGERRLAPVADRRSPARPALRPTTTAGLANDAMVHLSLASPTAPAPLGDEPESSGRAATPWWRDRQPASAAGR